MTTEQPFLRLLGSFLVEWSEKPTVQSPMLRRKTRALLAYLAVTAQPHSRQALSARFFPESADPLGALRWQLSYIRRTLALDLLVVTQTSVALNVESHQVDTTIFAEALGSNLAVIPLAELFAALDLYRGDLLAGISLPDAPEFDLWLLGQRIHFQRLYEQGLTAALERLIAQNDYIDALQWGQKLVECNPLLEEAHLRLSWLYAQTGQRDAALTQIENCIRILQEELAVDPVPELIALREQILGGQALQRPQVATVPATGMNPLPTAGDFVGRDTELEELLTLWPLTVQDQGAVVLIEAEMGGGKSRLLAEWAHQLPIDTAFVGNCYESTQTHPFRPWIDLIESALTYAGDLHLDALSPFWLQQLVYLVPAIASAVTDGDKLLMNMGPMPLHNVPQEHLFGAVAEFLTTGIGRPCLVIIDDLQWADESSIRLFHFIAQRTARLPIILAGAFRSEEIDSSGHLHTLIGDLTRSQARHFTLANLSPEAILALLTAIWSELPPGYRPHITNMLHQSTGGNPLFVIEVIRELRNSEGLPQQLPIPDTIRTLIHRRLQKMPTGCKQVFEALAILERQSTLALIQAVSARSEDESMMAVELGLQQGNLAAHTQDGPIVFNFRHDLIRNAVLAQLSPVRRQVLHRRAATALEVSASPASLAFHWARAGDLQKEGHYAALAGEEAVRFNAGKDAQRFLTRALELIDDAARRYVLQAHLADSWFFTGQWDDADALYIQVLTQLQTDEQPTLQAQCWAGRGRIARNRAAYADALDWLSRAQQLFIALDNKEGLARIVGEIGAVYWRQSNYAQAVKHFQQQLDLAQRTGDRLREAVAIGAVAAVHVDQCNYDVGLQQYARSRAIFAEVGHRSGMGKITGNMGVAYAGKGDYTEAMNCFQQQWQIDFELGDQPGRANAVSFMATLYQLCGDFANSLACYRQEIEVWLDLGDRRSLSSALGNINSIYTLQGRFAEASEFSQRAIALGRKLDVPHLLCSYLHNEADRLLRQGRYVEAIPFNAEALALAEQIGRKDVLFGATVASIRLAALSEKIDPNLAVQQLEMLLSEWVEASQQARLYYEIWRLAPKRATAQNMAAQLYEKLYVTTPQYQHRTRYQRLTGKTLPKPPPLPEPPRLFEAELSPVAGLLRQIDEIIAGS